MNIPITIDISWIGVLMLSCLLIGIILGVRMARPRSRWE
jgi:hypothetical protein